MGQGRDKIDDLDTGMMERLSHDKKSDTTGRVISKSAQIWRGSARSATSLTAKQCLAETLDQSTNAL
jgi:hypothetical protein